MVLFFFPSILKCSWKSVTSFFVRLLCDRVKTLGVHSLAMFSNHSSTEVLISYPVKKLLAIELEALFLEERMQF